MSTGTHSPVAALGGIRSTRIRNPAEIDHRRRAGRHAAARVRVPRPRGMPSLAVAASALLISRSSGATVVVAGWLPGCPDDGLLRSQPLKHSHR